MAELAFLASTPGSIPTIFSLSSYPHSFSLSMSHLQGLRNDQELELLLANAKAHSDPSADLERPIHPMPRPNAAQADTSEFIVSLLTYTDALGFP